MTLGLTRGEIILVAFIFGLIYLSGLLPRIASRLAGGAKEPKQGPAEPPAQKGE